MLGDEEYHTLCFICSLLSHVVIKLCRFYFPWERESFDFIPQHALVRLPLLYHIALSQPPPHLSQSNQHLYKHHRPQVSERSKDAVQCLNSSISLHRQHHWRGGGICSKIRCFRINTASVINFTFPSGAVALQAEAWLILLSSPASTFLPATVTGSRCFILYRDPRMALWNYWMT